MFAMFWYFFAQYKHYNRKLMGGTMDRSHDFEDGISLYPLCNYDIERTVVSWTRWRLACVWIITTTGLVKTSSVRIPEASGYSL